MDYAPRRCDVVSRAVGCLEEKKQEDRIERVRIAITTSYPLFRTEHGASGGGGSQHCREECERWQGASRLGVV